MQVHDEDVAIQYVGVLKDIYLWDVLWSNFKSSSFYAMQVGVEWDWYKGEPNLPMR
jgi:hypothetical protein